MTRRRGTVLLMVMVIMALAAMVAAGLLYNVQAQNNLSVASRRSQQAYAAAVSGIHYACGILKHNIKNPRLWLEDNPELFRNHMVCDDGVDKWFFTIYAPYPPEHKQPLFGIVDEAGKLNLNRADEKMLQALFARYATLGSNTSAAELSDCLLDYMGRPVLDAQGKPTDQTRPQGARQDYYDKLPVPYMIKGGPLTTLEEVLLVKGFNGTIVYGEDANMNGILDPNENDGDESFPPDNSDGSLDCGLIGNATVWSSRPKSTSKDIVDINSASLEQLTGGGLSQEAAKFVLAYKEEGNKFRSPADLIEAEYKLKNKSSQFPDLSAGATIVSTVTADQVDDLMSKFTAGGPETQNLLYVNVNSAPVAVLSAMLEGDDGSAQKIVDARQARAREELSADEPQGVGWLLKENVLDLEKFKQIAPYIGATSYQFRIRCVGFGYPCGRFRIIEAVVDVQTGSPRILYQRDITRLGMPFATDVEKEMRSK